jgi:hypothetical protein
LQSAFCSGDEDKEEDKKKKGGAGDQLQVDEKMEEIIEAISRQKLARCPKPGLFLICGARRRCISAERPGTVRSCFVCEVREVKV